MSPKYNYVLAICKEIELRKSYIADGIVDTIYFGGGTPQLSVEDFNKIFETIYNTFEVSSDAEITMEANPDDLDISYLDSLQALPFNRLSMGVQSFNDDELKFKAKASLQKERSML